MGSNPNGYPPALAARPPHPEGARMSNLNILSKEGVGGVDGLRNQPLGFQRILRQPRWIAEDLLPTAFEAKRPLRYARATGLWFRIRQSGFTMLGCRRGRYLYELADEAVRRAVPGALVDCGVWNGGSTALLSAGAPDRDVWAFDSFEGLPEPGDAELDGADAASFVGDCFGAEENLRTIVAKHGSAERLHVRKGWFEDTLAPASPEIGPIAVLHADGDWYESIKLTLEALYDQVSTNGFVAIDDYFVWEGARKATDEFRAERGITAPLVKREAGVYWCKLPT